ncbi:MAG: hypothetical protein HC844_06780 [Tabrizicola sp.]|nr:hypothetical protein [Tabrizicola sp.]
MVSETDVARESHGGAPACAPVPFRLAFRIGLGAALAGVLAFHPVVSAADAVPADLTGDWGVPGLPDHSCEDNPWRIAVIDDGRFVEMSLPKALPSFDGTPVAPKRFPVVAVVGRQIDIVDDLFGRIQRLELSADGQTLFSRIILEDGATTNNPLFFSRCTAAEAGA